MELYSTHGETTVKAPAAASLPAILAAIPDYRGRKGRRHSIASHAGGDHLWALNRSKGMRCDCSMVARSRTGVLAFDWLPKKATNIKLLQRCLSRLAARLTGECRSILGDGVPGSSCWRTLARSSRWQNVQWNLAGPRPKHSFAGDV